MSDQTCTLKPTPALEVGRGAGLVAAFILIAAFTGTLALWFIRKPTDILYLAWSTPEGLAILAGWGVPVHWWIAWYATLMIALLAISVAAAVLLLRAEISWFRLYLAFALVLFATLGSDLTVVFDAMYPDLESVGERLQGVGWLSLYLLAYLFPDGQFVPRWTRWFAMAFGIYIVLAMSGVSLHLPGWNILEAPALITLIGSCFVAQIYRYVRVSSHLERQQTRWLLTAFALWFVYGVFFNVTPLGDLYTEASPAGLVTHALGTLVSMSILALIPISITIAILRYRLYDIDVWISRALLYAVLTGFVIATYAAVVAGVGRLWSGSESLTSLLAAAIVSISFNPVRLYVQARVNRIVFGDRDDPYRALSQLGQQLEHRVRPEGVAPAIVETVTRALKAPYAALTLGADGAIAASAGRETSDVEAFALRHGDEYLGTLLVGQRSPGERFSPADNRLLTDLARHSGIALFAAQESLKTREMASDLQQVRERLVTSREEERRRIRRDLHDSLGPALGSQALTIDVIVSLIERDPAAAAEMLAEVKANSQEMLAQVRQLARELRPPVLDELGLSPALVSIQETYQRHGLNIALTVPDLPELPAAVEVAAYRIVDEAITNVVRHAQATTCDVCVSIDNDLLEINVSDNGNGFKQDARSGVGTASMRERAEELGGTFNVISRTGLGTHLEARLPITRAARA